MSGHSRRGKMRNEALTTGQVAEYCQVTYRAVLKWIEEGKLKAYRTPGQHSRVHVKDFIDFLKIYNMPIPAALDETRRKKRILIIDDDRHLVDLIRRTLQMEKIYEVKAAHDGFSGGRAFSDFKPDLAVLDINMPGLDGYQVCENIREDTAYKNVKILVISGQGDDEVKQKIFDLGANAFMPKPFETTVLVKKIEKLLGIKEEDKKEISG